MAHDDKYFFSPAFPLFGRGAKTQAGLAERLVAVLPAVAAGQLSLAPPPPPPEEGWKAGDRLRRRARGRRPP